MVTNRRTTVRDDRRILIQFISITDVYPVSGDKIIVGFLSMRRKRDKQRDLPRGSPHCKSPLKRSSSGAGIRSSPPLRSIIPKLALPPIKIISRALISRKLCAKNRKRISSIVPSNTVPLHLLEPPPTLPISKPSPPLTLSLSLPLAHPADFTVCMRYLRL